jgi:ATP-dependent Lon protease
MKAFSKKGNQSIPEAMPIIPTMDVVVFPHMIVPLLVVDERIIKGINTALENSKLILLLASSKDSTNYNEAISTKDLYQIGTVATIMRVVNIPDGGIKVLVQGVSKAKAENIITEEDMLYAYITPFEKESSKKSEQELEAHIRNLKILSEKITNSNQLFNPDFQIILSKMQDPEKIADFVISHLNLSVNQSQELLEQASDVELIKAIYNLLKKEIDVTEVQEKIRNNARDSMNKSQKEFYLREQLKAIKKELGDEDEDIEQLEEKLLTLNIEEDVKKEIKRNLSRLERTSPDSMEATVLRNYLETILGLPWGIETEDNLNIERAKEILEQDHYGLREIKDRILDFISIRTLKRDGYSPILCFAGPPGTGKTSLGKSIARSLGRKYVRVSLGGVKDEAEIRGHRRTYVGAMPGRFIQAIKKAGSCNPVVIIDELDKIGSDFRGDPSAAMLEVLDPNQNKSFYDNYLGVPFDLSKVIFIATANRLDTISEPLKDRMEIITLSGYTELEKLAIAKKYLVKKGIYETGLTEDQVILNDAVLKNIINFYTKESGVRELERMIKKLCSKAVRHLVEENKVPKFKTNNIDKFLGPKRFISDEVNKRDQIGICNGLAWTVYGGEMIQIEAVLMPGKGNLILTGQLGSVMKESAQAALSYARAHSKDLGIPDAIFVKNDIHIHVPAGAVPKDGPSAGITILTAMISIFTQKPICADCAMTGEINLQGEILPIGGVKEKVLAAKRNGISQVILPMKNKNDLTHLDEEVTSGIKLMWVSKAEEVLNFILTTINKPNLKTIQIIK